MPAYPDLVVVPGYPVYYAPQVAANYFFYDGLYWVYVNDGWYASYWYNGPWSLVAPEVVPVYILRVPVRYYRAAPVYFHPWRVDAPPRWGDHWGPQWQQRRAGWDRSDRRTAPPPAPLPTYQRAYSGNRYPSFDEQTRMHAKNYRYEPREAVVREAYRVQREQRPAARNEPPGQRQQRAAEQPDQRQRQAAQQRDHPGRDSEREPQRRDAERRDDQQRQAVQQREQQRRDAERQRQAAQQREPQRRDAEREQQERQAAQQQREQQERRAAAQREHQRQASRAQEAPPRHQPAPAPQQHVGPPREHDVQRGNRSEHGAPPPSQQREPQPRKGDGKGQDADDDRKGNRK